MAEKSNSHTPLYTPYFKDDWHDNPVIYINCETKKNEILKVRGAKCVIGKLENYQSSFGEDVNHYIGICIFAGTGKVRKSKRIKVPCPAFAYELDDQGERKNKNIMVVVRVMNEDPSNRDRKAVFEIPTGPASTLP